ncbi:MAG: hypothetical protein WAR57_11160 [Candidatus Phosphoribacter sp.]
MATKYTIRIHAIPLSDADGGRANTVTADQFAIAVDGMNTIFEPADIRFAFDPDRDWRPRRDTSLNSLNNGGSDWWVEANGVAAGLRGHLVVFLRWGKDPDKRASNWFAYPPDTGQNQPPSAQLPTPNVDFVAVTNSGNGFEDRAGVLAHEFGHYLGLFHTHPGWGNTAVETIESLVSVGGTAALDGDLLSDTPPDPGRFYYTEQVDASSCGGPASFKIGGKTFTPQRSNLMSYFRCPPVTITEQQITVIRTTLRHPTREHLVEASAGVRYAGVFLPGSDAHALWVGDDWEGFTDKWKALSADGLRLIDLESYVIGGRRRFTGVFRSGSGGHALWVDDDWKGFTDKWKALSADGLRLHSFETWGEGNGRRYAGVFLAGSGGHALWVDDDWKGFTDKWTALSADGLRLHDFETWVEGRTRKYAGVFLPGSGGHALWFNDDWFGFHRKWQELSGQGLRLVDIEVFGSLVD